MGSVSVPHPDYLVTVVGPGSGAGSGVPGAAVRDAATGRVIDRLPGQLDVYSAVTGTGSNRMFFLAARSSRARAAAEPELAKVSAGRGAFAVRIDDAGKIADLSGVPGVPEPEDVGPVSLAATADGSRLALPVVRRHHGPPAPLGAAGALPAEIGIVTVATGARSVWRASSDGFIGNLSFSADGRRLAFSWDGAEGSGIRVADLPAAAAGQVVTTPSHLVVGRQNSLGNLGDAVISPDGATLFVTAARYGSRGRPVTRLYEVSVADGSPLRVAYERHGAYPGNIIFGWGPLALDGSGQHALIAYTGNLARIDLRTGQLTEMPIEENGAHAIAW